MKTYIHLFALVGFLCCSACANKNVPTEDAQQLTQSNIVEGYDVGAVVASICGCLDEKAATRKTTLKKTNTSQMNLKAFKGKCEQQAYTEHGQPTSKAVKMSIENAFESQCGHYIKSNQNSTPPEKYIQRKDPITGKKEPARTKVKTGPIPQLVPEKE